MKSIFALTCAVCLAASFVSPVRAQEKIEPKYEGKPLGYWVERLQRSETDEARSKAVQALKEFKQEAAPVVPQLVKMLDDRSRQFRSEVGDILYSIGPGAKAAVPDLVRSLREKTARSPDVVLEVLGAIGPEAAREGIPFIIAAIEGKLEVDAESAVVSLCEIGAEGAVGIPAIRRHLQERVKRYPDTTCLFLHDLPKLGDPGIALLAELLAFTDRRIVWDSAETLGREGPKAKIAVPALKKVLSHSEPMVRLEAATALWKIEQNVAAISVLVKLLEEGDADVFSVSFAAMSLKEIGKQAIPSLIKAHNQRHDRKETAFFNAIKAIDPSEAQKLSEHKVSPSDWWTAVPK